MSSFDEVVSEAVQEELQWIRGNGII